MRHYRSVRRKLLIGLVLYLIVGALFGLNTSREDYMCPALMSNDGSGYYAPLPEQNIRLVELDRDCLMISKADRLKWFAVSTPGWLPLVVRSVAQGQGIPLGNIVLGGH